MQTIIFHLDMNSYFASVEQQDNPQYRGRPLGVCEHLGGIIIAASIEAKRWGIKTGTPVWEARKLYPKIILSPTHPDRYRMYTARMVKVVGDYTDFVEQYSIDEVFFDISKACNIKIPNDKFQITNKIQMSNYKYQTRGDYYRAVDPFEEAVRVALEIKARMKKEVGDYLTCSIGIAENKLLAKIASDLKKPDGIVVIFSGRERSRPFPTGIIGFTVDDLYRRLRLTDIPGIGRRQEKNLNQLGIKTLLELKNYPPSLLVARFGILGYHLHQMGQLSSSWKPEVRQDTTIKSIGHMYTLPMEFRKQKYFVPVLYKLCEMVASRLRKQGLSGNIIHFYISDKNYQGFGESRKLGFYVFDGREIFLQAMSIFERVSGTFSDIVPDTLTEFKLIGITVAGLRPQVNQLTLFGYDERLKRITSALDKINSKYGDFTVCRVPILAAGNAFHDSIGFGRIKEKLRSTD